MEMPRVMFVDDEDHNSIPALRNEEGGHTEKVHKVGNVLL
jgi:hypothetical protein